VNLPNPSFYHDVYEKAEGYHAIDISSFYQFIENAKVTGSLGMRKGAKKTKGESHDVDESKGDKK